MRQSLSVELRRAFCSRGFIIAIGLGGIMVVLAFFNTQAWTLSKYWLSYMAGESAAVESAVHMGFVDTPLEIWMPRYGASSKFYYLWITILPLLCALPYGTSYLYDKKNGLINQLIYRMNRKNYYLSKFITCFVSGGTISTLPLVLNLLLCMCFLPWGMPLRSTSVYPIGESNAFSDVFYTKPLLYVMIYLLLTFILFGLINCLCLIFSLIEDNQFALMITPFVIYFAQHVLISFGLGRGEISFVNNANLYNVYSQTLYIYLLELLGLFIIDICVFIKIKKDVL